MRVCSTTVATVGLVVVMSGVTSPATVTAVAVVPNFSTGSTTADWPASRLSAPFHASILADSTEILILSHLNRREKVEADFVGLGLVLAAGGGVDNGDCGAG